MNTIDFSPLYRSTIGFDRFASMLDHALRSESAPAGYPPYNIEMLEDEKYTITVAVAGFSQEEIDIQVENNVLTIHGKKSDNVERNFLYQGIANRSFERKFNLADHIEVTGAALNNGLLVINLVKEVPEAMKPRKIEISDSAQVIEHKDAESKAA
jgi:molecular chaperone IbpA